MPSTLSKEEIVERGRELYERDIAPKISEGERGRFLVVDVLTGDYAIAETDIAAANQVKARAPNAVLYYMRIGSPAAYRLGGSLRLKR